MSIKTKVTAGVLFLFAVILAIGGLGLYYLNRLSTDSKNILKNNYESIEYTRHIITGSDSLALDSARAMKLIETNLEKQEQNLTEKGERELTLAIRSAVEKMKNGAINNDQIAEIRTLCLSIQDLNMQAIIRKNTLTQNTADDASSYLVIIGTICILAAFTFIINFPGYIANPIAQLTASIQSIANKNYEERLHFDRKDEFEELAEAFNLMAEKLDEYEHSNLANIISEKKRIETIINRMTDPVIGLDDNQKVIFVNDQALNLLNLTSKDILEKYAPDVAVNNDLLRNLIRQNNKSEDAPALIKAVIHNKENYFSRETIDIKYTPTGEKEELRAGQVILLKNITSYKELDLAKTNFIATISHELKTPIASLQMCVKLLHDKRVGSLNEEQQSIVRTLRDEVGRLSNITNELLDLSQVETGHIKLNIQSASASAITEMAIEAVKFQAERKHIQIQTNPVDAQLTLKADQDKTTWVLVNFLTNAIRYSPEGETIVLHCEKENGKVTFSVADHGAGIEEKFISRIFDKFFQIPGTAAGTGLGLAISKEFIEAQQGSIKVVSEYGKGSTFSFTLPVG